MSQTLERRHIAHKSIELDHELEGRIIGTKVIKVTNEAGMTRYSNFVRVIRYSQTHPGTHLVTVRLMTTDSRDVDGMSVGSAVFFRGLLNSWLDKDFVAVKQELRVIGIGQYSHKTISERLKVLH